MLSLADWDFQFAPEFGNPIGWLNLAGFVCALVLLSKLRERKSESAVKEGAWAATLVLAIGTGLHFLGDLTNFPEDWDHVMVHAALLVALIVFLVAVVRDQ